MPVSQYYIVLTKLETAETAYLCLQLHACCLVLSLSQQLHALFAFTATRNWISILQGSLFWNASIIIKMVAINYENQCYLCLVKVMTRLMLLLLCFLIVGGTPDAAWDSLEVGGTPDIGDAWGTPESWGALEVGDSQDDLDLSALGGSDDQLQGTFDPLDRWGALDHWGTPSVGSPSDLGSTPAPAVLGGTIARVVPGGSIARVFGNPSVGAGGDTPEAAGGDALFIESTDLPVIGDTTVIKPSFHIVSKNTTLNVTCSISNISETVDIMWSYNGLGT